MLLNAIVAVIAAFAAVGIVLGVARLIGVRPPKATVPVVAAIAIMLFTAWNRYSWAERTIQGLPEGSVVIATYDYEGALEPWTRIWPRADRIVAVEGQPARHPDSPHLRLVSTLLIEQDSGTSRMWQYVDCERRRHAPASIEAGDQSWLAQDAQTWIEDGPAALFDATCR